MVLGGFAATGVVAIYPNQSHTAHHERLSRNMRCQQLCLENVPVVII